MTRLRFNLKDQSKVKLDDIKSMKGVLGCQFSSGTVSGYHWSDCRTRI